jgi:hypothetical protein
MSSPGAQSKIEEFLLAYPALADRLARQLLMVLHNEGLATVDAVYDEARQMTGEGPAAPEEADPNRPSTLRWAGKERDAVREVVLRHAAAHLSEDRIGEILNVVRRREEAESLETIANIQAVPYHVLADTLRSFCAIPRGDDQLPQPQTTGLRVALTRNFISDQLEFIAVAKGFLRIPDFQWILDRVIGPARGQGRIGGKAAGMFLGYRILEGARKERAGEPMAAVHLPESWFLRSDVIAEFLRLNHLGEYQNQKYKDAESIRNEYPLIRQVFHNAEFPPEMATKLGKLLEQVGRHPLIVRSSSLLEDRFGAAFSGMYASVFLANQGTLRERLKALIGAVVEVYASTLGPNPLLYRRRHNLVDYNEDMAILIQKVVGRRHGRWLLPDVAGVAFSRNEYRWSPRIRPEDGVARIVLGLGTRAVDRTGNDYPRMVPLGAPRLRPEVTPEGIQRYSQRFVDAIDLSSNEFRTTTLADLLAEGPLPGLEQAASIVTEDAVVEPTGQVEGIPAGRLCLTFDRLLGRTRFPALLKDRLRLLEDAYEVPINVEFAQVGDEFYLLQCRPLVQAEAAEATRLPRGVGPDQVIFSTRGIVRSGEVRDIRYAVFVDPAAYDAAGTEVRVEIGRAVARVNDALEGESFLLLGPGRWGSNDSRLGVKVNYADINHCRVLIEIAVRKGSFVPEVSYGTHFFQDLVEDGIYYLALYPDEERTIYRGPFFTASPNALASVVPRDADLERYLRVIRVDEAAPGRRLHLVMDGESAEALCWLS